MDIFGVMRMNSLKSRIYIQNAITLLGLLFFLEITFIIFVNAYYLGSAKNELINKLNFSSTLYNKYMPKMSNEERLCYILENESINNSFFVQIIDNNFNLLIDSNGTNVHTPHELFSSSNMQLEYKDLLLAADNNPTVNESTVSGENILSMSVPIYDKDNNVWAYLRYTTCINNLKSNISDIINISIGVMSLCLIISLFFSSILVKKIVTPIEHIIEVSRKMANGNFNERVKIKSKDEIGILGNTLDYMANEIDKNNKMKNDFISSISHELRTPLTAIKGWGELILTGELKNSEDINQGIEIISNETNRLSNLVEDLLDFSRLEGGRITLHKETLDLSLLLQDIKLYFKTRLEENNIELQISIRENDMNIVADRDRLKQVFINLIHNSIKFSKPNHKIFITIEKNKRYVEIKVKDQGIGISPKDIHKVKEKFYKGSSTQSGSGIGLAICDEIVSLHNGHLTIESIEYEGTTVMVRLPIQ